MKRMLFNATFHEELRVATVEGQKLINFDIETSSKTQRRGNIYKGVITRIETSLEACFVDYGTEKQGFLPFKEIDERYIPQAGRTRDLSKLSLGLELIIQVDKDERGNKGAALTTFVSLPGRYLVLMPNSSRSGGISRRIDGEERDELKSSLTQVEVPSGMSIIARTAALGRVQEELQWDLNYLCNLWDAIQTASQNNSGSFLIYQESSLVIRSIRDHFSPDISEILIDMPDIFDQAKQFMAHVMPTFVNRVKLYNDDVPLFSRFQIEHQIESAYGRMVTLPSGGSIAIDHTEALTAIDVNSAKSNKGADIEATALATNLEAAEEVARQLRLRDLGGLVVVDFIDMENMRNQREVESHFKQQLGLDRARIQMGKLSKFGLLELSRQRLSTSLDESTAITCPRCDGIGTIRGTESSAIHILRIIQEEALKGHGYLSALHVQLPLQVATYLLNEKRDDVAKIENRLKIKVVLIPNVQLESPHYRIRKIVLDSPEGINAKVSYNLVENIDESSLSYQTNNKKLNRTDTKAIVKNITPSQPAPIISGKSLFNSLIGKLIKFFKSEPAVSKGPILTKPINNNAGPRQNTRSKSNKRKPIGQATNNTSIKDQAVRPSTPKNVQKINQADTKTDKLERNNVTTKPSTTPTTPRQLSVAKQQPVLASTTPKQRNTTSATAPISNKAAINQEWQEIKPIIVQKDEPITNIVAKVSPDKPIEEIKHEIKKPVLNTITQPVDLGVLQMVATNQNLSNNNITSEIKIDINLKRFNDTIIDKSEAYLKQEEPQYELVETKA